MVFDKSRVYTAVNADELQIGSKIIGADTLGILKSQVEQGADTLILKEIKPEEYQHRFRCVKEDLVSYDNWGMVYLVEEPSSLKWTDLKVGDVIQRDGISFMVVGKDEVSDTHMHIFIGGTQWLSDEALKAYRKVD